jgi:glycosyltransferase involved in cell wall biosynthesis
MARLLIVHDTLGDLGGAEACVRHTTHGLQQRKHDAALLYGTSSGTGEDPFHSLFPKRWTWKHDWQRNKQDIINWQPDCIIAHKVADLSILDFLLSLNIPSIRLVHDHHMYCQRGYRYFPWNRKICTRRAGYACALTCGVLRNRDGKLPIRFAWPSSKLKEIRLCKQFSRHVVVTEFMRQELVQHGFNNDSIVILPPMPKPAPANYQATWSKPRALFVGQLVRGKGCDHFIQALKHLSTADWDAYIIGEGPERTNCEELVGSLGLEDRVTFTGWIDQHKLHECYTTARIGVIPSMWPEPIATIGLEFLHHSLPVVAYDAGGIKDWLHDGENGHLVEYAQPKALAQSMDRILSDRNLAERMGTEAFKLAQTNYQQHTYFDRLAALVSEELTQHPKAPS